MLRDLPRLRPYEQVYDWGVTVNFTYVADVLVVLLAALDEEAE